MIKTKSEINYSYATVRLTKGRIAKGLIALPKDLAGMFPENNSKIQIYLDDSKTLFTKNFTSHTSKTNESRIGGMREWFENNKFKDGDEIVIQIIDKEKPVYRLIQEDKFISTTKKLQKCFDKSETDEEANENILTIAQWTELEKEKVIWNEFYRHTFLEKLEDRKYTQKQLDKAKETAPSNYRIILGGIYSGLCQVCEFGFLKKNNKPYFELHHIKPDKGHHPKNLLLICANCHKQFEHANVTEDFNSDGWLVRVKFNHAEFSVNQIALKTKSENYFKQTYLMDQ
jgi:hypothetical protein